jgi:hypothetical protein
MTPMLLALLLAAAIAGSGPAAPPVVENTFRVEAAGEAVLFLEAGCEACDWGVRGREAAVLVVEVDGVYSQHVVLFRGAAAEYRLLLGPLGAGEHRLLVTRDRKRSAPRAGAVSVTRASVEAIVPEDARYPVVADAPVLHARRGSIERFSDVPLLLYVESDREAGLDERRYTYLFSNEDGGTPPDRLMATWGRVTDIELAYAVARDGGRVVREEIQAKDHVVRPFAGRRLGAHPILHVATRNNMFDDHGRGTPRLAPAPLAVELGAASREAVMDAHDWTYRISSQEVRREGRVSTATRPGGGRIPDPSRFAYLEACGAVEDARVAFDLVLEGRAEPVPSDARGSDFRIGRGGCFRSAIPLPPRAEASSIRAVRVRAHAAPGDGRRDPGRRPLVRIDRMNRLFTLDEADRPRPSASSWTGPAVVTVGGPPLVVPATWASPAASAGR